MLQILTMQDPDKIKKIAMELDNALEAKDFEFLKSCFTSDCEIELIGLKLKGISGVEKWLKYIFNYVVKFKLEPVVIMVEDDVFFEEFIVNAQLPDGTTIKSKWAEVLVYEDYKIKSLRLYFDRLDFAKAIAGGYISKKIINFIIKKSLKGLV